MQLTNAAFPRLDLQRHRMLDLSFSCLIDDELSTMALLRGLDLLNTGDFVSTSQYASGKASHTLVAQITTGLGGGLAYNGRYLVNLYQAPRRPQSSPKLEAKLLQQLSGLTKAYLFTCVCTLYYVEAEAEPFFPWFEPAVTIATTAPSAPSRITRIDRLDASKYTDDNHDDPDAFEYALVLDRGPDDEVSIEVELVLTSAPARDLATTFHGKVVAIADSLRISSGAHPAGGES